MPDIPTRLHTAQQEYQQLQLQRQRLQQQVQQQAQLQFLMQKIQEEQQQIHQLQTVVHTTHMSTTAVNPTVQTLAGLRQDSDLNRQADAILYGNSMTAAMIGSTQRPAPPGQTLSIPTPLATTALQAPTSSTGLPYMFTPPFPGMTPQTGMQQTQQSAKDKTLCPEQFAHRPGTVDLKFDQLQLTEFVEGYVNIITQGNMKAEESRARLEKLADIMGTASSYQWPKVRALIGVMLKEINNGQRTWDSSFSSLKERMLTPSDLLHNTPAKESGRTAPRKQACREFNWGECTQGSNCLLLHACDACLKFRKSVVDHTAKNCPHDPKNKK